MKTHSNVDVGGGKQMLNCTPLFSQRLALQDCFLRNKARFRFLSRHVVSSRCIDWSSHGLSVGFLSTSGFDYKGKPTDDSENSDPCVIFECLLGRERT